MFAHCHRLYMSPRGNAPGSSATHKSVVDKDKWGKRTSNQDWDFSKCGLKIPLFISRFIQNVIKRGIKSVCFSKCGNFFLIKTKKLKHNLNLGRLKKYPSWSFFVWARITINFSISFHCSLLFLTMEPLAKIWAPKHGGDENACMQPCLMFMSFNSAKSLHMFEDV